ncbi:MAG: hypothetical protein E5V17_01460, partial [Mesorhizobium sp.]
MAITLNLHNSDLADLFVSVIDLNLGGAQMTFSQRMNEGVTMQIAVQEDGRGQGRIRWNAQRADDPEATAERTVDVGQN